MRRLPAITLVLALLLPALAVQAGEPPARDNLLSLKVKDMDIRDVLEMIAVQRRISIVASQEITGKVTVNLYDLTEDEALEAVLGANGYTYTRKGKVIYVAKPPAEAPMKEMVFHLKWAIAEDIVKVLTNFSGKNGGIVKSETGDSVVVKDTEAAIQQMLRVVEELDCRPRQVMIEVQMIEIGENSLKKVGFNWSSLDQLSIMELTLERTMSRDKNEHKEAYTPEATELNRNIGSIVSIRGGILQENEFRVLASLFNNMSDSHIVSQPRIMTLDAKKASIIVGTIVPVPLFDFAKDTGVRTLSGFQDEQVGTEIEVTPHVREDSYILLDVVPKVEEITDYITVGGDRQRPIKSTRRAETQVMVRDGETMVIGGLRGKTRRGNTGRVPYLHKLPLIGGLFRNRTNDTHNTELIIFITPRIVEGPNLTDTEKEIEAVSSRFDLEPVWRDGYEP